MRRLALAIALACVISGMAHAGEIHTTGAVATPTPGPVTVAGQVPSTVGDPTAVLAIILTLISSVR